MASFSLDSRLAADSLAVADLSLSSLRLMRDSRFPWLLLVPRRPDLVEIIDLAEAEQAVLMREIALASEALKAETGCDKLNVGALGNIVSQLHVHVIARREGDVAWLGPVWGSGPAVPYAAGQAEALAAAIAGRLPKDAWVPFTSHAT